MPEELKEAIRRAESLGMTITEEPGEVLKVTYPSGEWRKIEKNNPKAAYLITDMANNLL